MPRLRTLLISVLALSGLLRVIVYFQNRSLFLDEANLSRNIIEKPYGELFGSLDYEQFCPPMYACTVKMCTQVFGVNEYSLRLFSLLLGLAALYLFYRLVRRLFDSPIALYPILLFGFSIYLVRYQTENKQYAADVFFALLFLWIGLEKKINTWGQFLALGIAGGLGIWFSMPLVFVLTGLGGFLFYQRWISENRVQGLLKWGSMATVWLASFAALYQVNLKASIGNKYLQDYYTTIYLEFPVSLKNIHQTYAVLRDFLSSTTDHTFIPLIWASICWVLGIYVLVKKDVGKALLIGLPIASSFLASMLHQFILIPVLGSFNAIIFHFDWSWG
ncbi:MAG: glycosyltransferase family 39 protein [Saprospiraceae bacterium]